MITFFKARSFIHLLKIFLIFGLAGTVSVFFSSPILNFIHLKQNIDNNLLYIFLRLLIIFPLYQFSLFILAILMGEYPYFSKFFKKYLTFFNKK